MKIFTIKNIKPKLKLICNLFLFALFLTVSACGFEKVYNINNSNKFYLQELAAIKIQEQHSHLHQQLRNNLLDILNYNYIQVETKYLLVLTIKKSISSTFITYYGSPGRNHLTLDVHYELRDIKTSNIIASGDTSSGDDFNLESKRYANYIAEEYTEENLTKLIAQNIRSLLVNDLIELEKKHLK